MRHSQVQSSIEQPLQRRHQLFWGISMSNWLWKSHARADGDDGGRGDDVNRSEGFGGLHDGCLCVVWEF